MTERRQRWRMTLDELCYAARVTPEKLEHWASLGALGPRWQEPRDRGKWRHISREAAHRAIIMSRLVDAGLQDWQAAATASIHKVEDSGLPLRVTSPNGVGITIDRSDLDLP